MRFHQRPRRLPRPDYVGEKTTSFVAVAQSRERYFVNPDIVRAMVQQLQLAANKHHCLVPIYCFMPDHLHVMFKGFSADSDGLAAMINFKIRSGKWLFQHDVGKWQRDFFDHIMRYGDDWRHHVAYIAQNPVRAGLVNNCFDYPYLGTIGCDLQDIISRMD